VRTGSMRSLWAGVFVLMLLVPFALGDELKIRVIDNTLSMSDSGKLDAAKPVIREEWQAARARSQDFTVIAFDSEVRQLRTVSELDDLGGKATLSPRSYEALARAVSRAWEAIASNPATHAEIVVYTDGKLTMALDALPALAKQTGALNPTDEAAFVEKYNRRIAAGQIRLYFIVLGDRQLNDKQRGVVLGMRGQIISLADWPPKLLDWYVDAPATAWEVFLGQGERRGLQAPVELGALRFDAVGWPGLASGTGQFRLSATGLAGRPLKLSPEIVPYASVPATIAVSAPDGAVLAEGTSDIVIKCSPEGFPEVYREGLAGKQEEALRNVFSVSYLGARLDGPRPADIGTVQPNGQSEKMARWTISFPEKMVELKDRFPVTYTLSVTPEVPAEAIALSIDAQEGKPLSGEITADKQEMAIEASVKNAPRVAGRYEIALELGGRCFEQGRYKSGPAEFAVAATELPNVRISTNDARREAAPGQEVAFEAFSVTSEDARAAGGRLTLGPASDKSGLESLKLVAQPADIDLMNGAVDIPAPAQANRPVRYSFRVKLSPGVTGEAVEFRLPGEGKGLRVDGSQTTSLAFRVYVTKPLPHVAVVKGAAPDKTAAGKDCQFEAFSVNWDDAALGKQLVLGQAQNIRDVESLMLSGPGEYDVLRGGAKIVFKPGMPRPLAFRLRVGISGKAQYGASAFTLPIEGRDIIVDGLDAGNALSFTIEHTEPCIQFSGAPAFPGILAYGLAAYSPADAIVTSPFNTGSAACKAQFALLTQEIPESIKVTIACGQDSGPLPHDGEVGGAERKWQLGLLLAPPPSATPGAVNEVHFSVAASPLAGAKIPFKGWTPREDGAVQSTDVTARVAAPAWILVKPGTDESIGKDPLKIELPSGAAGDLTEPFELRLTPPLGDFVPELRDALSQQQLAFRITNCEGEPGITVDAALVDADGSPATGSAIDWAQPGRPVRVKVECSKRPSSAVRATVEIASVGGQVTPAPVPLALTVAPKITPWWVYLVWSIFVLLLLFVLALFGRWLYNHVAKDLPSLKGCSLSADETEYHLAGSKAVIGSRQGVSVELKKDDVAPKHAVITIKKVGSGDEVRIAHAAGREFITSIGGTPVTREGMPLFDGMEITIGSTICLFKRSVESVPVDETAVSAAEPTGFSKDEVL